MPDLDLEAIKERCAYWTTLPVGTPEEHFVSRELIRTDLPACFEEIEMLRDAVKSMAKSTVAAEMKQTYAERDNAVLRARVKELEEELENEVERRPRGGCVMTEERMCANCANLELRANLELPPEGGQCSGCRDSTASRWLPADYYVLQARVKELEEESLMLQRQLLDGR
mgnify:FL=1